jgi:hypothetical protein
MNDQGMCCLNVTLDVFSLLRNYDVEPDFCLFNLSPVRFPLPPNLEISKRDILS